MTKKSAERARRGRAASQAGLCYVRSAVRAVIRLRRIGQRGERDGEVKEASSTATSTARGVARQGADSVTHSTDGRRRRVRAMPLFTDARRPAALPRLWRCAWRRAPARRDNHAPKEASRRRTCATVRCTSSGQLGMHTRSRACRLLFCTPLAGRTQRVLWQRRHAAHCAVLEARGGGLEPAAATVFHAVRCGAPKH